MPKFITSQNVELQFELASLGDRIIAFLIDGFILVPYMIIALMITSGTFEGMIFILMIPPMFYSLLFETFGNGQTPGKKSRDIKVVKLNGGSPVFANYLLRWIFRPVDIILYGAVAVALIIITKNGQRLGDIIAGTTVIKITSSVSHDDIRTIAKEAHVVEFPQVRRLSDAQIEIIRKALQMRRDGFNDEAVQEISEKLKSFLSIQTELPDVKFLYTLIADHEHLNS